MPPAVFEPTIPASELPRTYTLRRAATGISSGDVSTHSRNSELRAEVPEYDT
jgi:hypothetical protein